MTTETTKFEEPWVLWYFDPRKNDWSFSNYKLVAEIRTPQQFWSIIPEIPRKAFECGYFFFMRKGVRPIWEVPENEHGGSWSKKIPTCDLYDIAIDLDPGRGDGGRIRFALFLARRRSRDGLQRRRQRIAE